MEKEKNGLKASRGGAFGDGGKKGLEANSLFDYDYKQVRPGSDGEQDANFASPTSSQFVRKNKTKDGK